MNLNLAGQLDVVFRCPAARTCELIGIDIHLRTYHSLEASRERSDLTALDDAIVLKIEVSQSLQSNASGNQLDTLQ